MFVYVPFREQHQFALQQRAVVFGQHVGLALRLEQHQRIDGVHVELMCRIMRELVQVGGRSEVGQQQEAALDILFQDRGNRYAGLAEYLGHMNKRTHIFLGRRCIHDDKGRSLRAIDPEVATETGVGRRGSQGVGLNG
jgi:hypothetical protein